MELLFFQFLFSCSGVTDNIVIIDRSRNFKNSSDGAKLYNFTWSVDEVDDFSGLLKIFAAKCRKNNLASHFKINSDNGIKF